MTNGQLPHFVSWNWMLIRCILFWSVLSGLLACLAAVVAMVVALPKTCNPETLWYEGKVFYEIFPASFQDSNGDGIGDLRGISTRIDYIKQMGVSAVRLNSMFQADHYPERFKNVSSLLNIDKTLGTLTDFGNLVKAFHEKNISVVIDLPVYPFVTHLESVFKPSDAETEANSTKDKTVKTYTKMYNESPITTAIQYWTSNGVDGFYLKGIEHLVDDEHFVDSLSLWKKIIGPERILITNYETVLKAKGSVLNNLMYKINLLEVTLDVGNGTKSIKQQINNIVEGPLWQKPGLPWVLWNVGNVDSSRLVTKVAKNNTLSALLLNLMLPGTPSVFYGDEIGLDEISEAEIDFHESEYIRHLAPMVWAGEERKFTGNKVLPWITSNDNTNLGILPPSLKAMINVRRLAPPIYLNAVWKEGVSLSNINIKMLDNLLMIERWYPRRNSYVLVINMGRSIVIENLSSYYYAGVVVVSTSNRVANSRITFQSVSLDPYEALVVKLDK